MSAPPETPSAVNTSASSLGKRKKSRGKSSYLGTWLERAARHIHQEPDYEYLPNPYPTLDSYRINGYCAPEAVSLPAYPFYPQPQVPGPFWPQDCKYIQSAHKSIQVQRPRVKRNQSVVTNGYIQPKYEDNNECTSLPPIVTSVGDTTSNSEANDKESGSARRFSDPCLPRLDEPVSEDGDGSMCEAPDSKLLMCLVDQINTLKLANERLHRDLQEAKAELQTVRHQASLWQKGSTSSLGQSNHGALNNNGYVTSPPHYTAGALADLVREIRDAARLREEALFARVRTLLDERTLNQSGLSCSLDKSTDSRNYEDIKSSLRASEADKRKLCERLSRLEADFRHIKGANGIPEEGSVESDSERFRRELSEARRDLHEARRAKQQADDNTLRLERLVTQLRSCKLTNGGSPPASLAPASLASASLASASLASDADESPGGRVRRSSTNSTTIVFGPVTDL